MKYIDEFRNRRLIDKVAGRIRAKADPRRGYNFMEVCGTHTMSIFRFGLRGILPGNINLISGPGCPVCVTPNEFIDKAIALARRKDSIIATFGDMFRVPGSHSSLDKEKARGAAVKMVYSSMDALELAKKNPDKEVIFLGIGFETTAPTVAQSIIAAKKEKLKNYSVLCGHKTMPEALKALTEEPKLNIDGFLLPGHVSAVIGTAPYRFLTKRGKRCVVAGIEPLDILQAILMLLEQKTPKIEIQYTRIITKSGNRLAKNSIDKVFEADDSSWRGIGCIKKSGLKIRKEFGAFDAEARFKPKIAAPKENKACICGEVIKGVKTPPECKLFAKLCTPEHPVGACMVSSEGACAAYYKYRGRI
ncbi:MAG: hydrogenase formation protein HypD [Candidatus Omnitrophica bacterium]|nr:hydrogenase formation protein HypD [Candidatus Omnitrophota bacterium]